MLSLSPILLRIHFVASCFLLLHAPFPLLALHLKFKAAFLSHLILIQISFSCISLNMEMLHTRRVARVWCFGGHIHVIDRGKKKGSTKFQPILEILGGGGTCPPVPPRGYAPASYMYMPNCFSLSPAVFACLFAQKLLKQQQQNKLNYSKLIFHGKPTCCDDLKINI